LHADQEKCGKGMYLMFTFPGNPTMSGLPVHSSGTAYCYSSHFRDHDIHRNTSPIEAVYCPDVKQSMYCQLLCGLIDRRIVDHVGGAFAHGFVKGVRFLEDNWEEMCSNIRTGHLSDWITHVPLRDAISQRYLRQPDPALADEIVSQCAGRPWDGILRRLWPGARYILTIVTGSMSQYIPILESYGAGLPIVSHTYVSTECAAGINLRPLDPPSRASYALLPNIAYYEFAEVKRGDDDMVQRTTDNFGGLKLVDLMNVKIGRCYELVITTSAG
jgi:auxin responsive GH3 family protein